MKFISWNVNGLRACMGKGFPEYFAAQGADFFQGGDGRLARIGPGSGVAGRLRIGGDGCRKHDGAG